MSDLESVKKLRSTTGAGFKDCNSALKEASGNLEKAIEILRIKGVSKASKKMSREANEGLVFICGDEKKTSIIEINCETDFVGKMKNGSTVSQNLIDLIAKIGEKITIGRSKTFESPKSKIFTYNHSIIKDNLSKLGVVVSLEFEKSSKDIVQFGKQISMHIAASNPMVIDKKDIKDDIIEKEKEIIKEELKNLGKPKEIAEKISLGKINKFKEDNSLLTQDWVMDPKLKVKDVLNKADSKSLKIKDFIRIKIGE